MENTTQPVPDYVKKGTKADKIMLGCVLLVALVIIVLPTYFATRSLIMLVGGSIVVESDKDLVDKSKYSTGLIVNVKGKLNGDILDLYDNSYSEEYSEYFTQFEGNSDILIYCSCRQEDGTPEINGYFPGQIYDGLSEFGDDGIPSEAEDFAANAIKKYGLVEHPRVLSISKYNTWGIWFVIVLQYGFSAFITICIVSAVIAGLLRAKKLKSASTTTSSQKV
jgi:hypothetical protein